MNFLIGMSVEFLWELNEIKLNYTIECWNK